MGALLEQQQGALATVSMGALLEEQEGALATLLSMGALLEEQGARDIKGALLKKTIKKPTTSTSPFLTEERKKKLAHLRTYVLIMDAPYQRNLASSARRRLARRRASARCEGRRPNCGSSATTASGSGAFWGVGVLCLPSGVPPPCSGRLVPPPCSGLLFFGAADRPCSTRPFNKIADCILSHWLAASVSDALARISLNSNVGKKRTRPTVPSIANP